MPKEGCTEQSGEPSPTGHKECIWVCIVWPVPPLQFCLIMMKVGLHIGFPRARAHRVVVSTDASELWCRIRMVWIVFQCPNSEDITRTQLKNQGRDQNLLEKKGPLVSMRKNRGVSGMSSWTMVLRSRGEGTDFYISTPYLPRTSRIDAKPRNHILEGTVAAFCIMEPRVVEIWWPEIWGYHGTSFSLASWPVGKGRVLSEKGILQWTM